MKGRILLILGLLLSVHHGWAQRAVTKTNDMKVYMHYMPWFETPASIGRWGWHWTMNNKNPNIVDANGKRQIAAHFYPLIGPYASRDKDVIEYHLLLMKLSGIDGVLINWYGTQGSNADVNDLLTSSNAIVSYVDDFGMQFGVIMEDRFSRNIEDAKANLRYLKNNYFNKPQYIRTGAGQDPLVGIFGPITFQQPSQWSQILAEGGEDIEFLTLWHESGDAGVNADGEYAWVYQDNRSHLDHLDSFYNNRAPQLKTVMGSAYPGFVDFYEEGGSGTGYFTIPHNNGATLDQTLTRLNQHKSKLDMVQLVTWNDYGEGTIFEPTLETGFEYLKKVQAYTGVSYGENELRLVHKLYQLRKQHANDAAIQQKLATASAHFSNLEIDAARAILNEIAPVTGILDEVAPGKSGRLFKVFPNPATGNEIEIGINRVGSLVAHLTISNVAGKILYQKEIAKGTSKVTVPIQHLSGGVYYVTVQSDAVSETQKLVLRP
ncbi:T9SS type A sorting domain-containing protein [Sabulibacter ruber]|uniref:T9SS type A sorting domain-containing protein n=1 Tax=Sabulibacter ruber TaxID=2811901 RepID=UPI001A96C51B|nr:T9SS type A sorting domain-containing protein [Sabulibacter ruber]